MAQIGDDTLFAQRLARETGIAAVQNQPMMRVQFVVRRHHLLELLLDLEWIFSRRQAGAIADAENMGVDRDGRLAKVPG